MRPALAALAITGLVVLAFSASHLSRSKPSGIPSQAATPERGWRLLASREFSFEPGQTSRWDIPHARGRIRVSVDAEQPVNFGFDIGGCEAQTVTHADAECSVAPAPAPTLLVADARDPGKSLLTAAAGMYAHSKSAVESSITRSAVKIDLYEWTCIANCPAK